MNWNVSYLHPNRVNLPPTRSHCNACTLTSPHLTSMPPFPPSHLALSGHRYIEDILSVGLVGVE